MLRKIYRSIRMFWFRTKYRLKHVHPTFYMGGSSDLQSDLKAGVYSYIGRQCIVYPRVELGDYSMLANNVSIAGADHIFNKAGVPIIFAGKEELGHTKIGKDVWIGSFSLVKAGITIGDGTIVAMGSVVTKDLEPYSIYAGVPARKIRDRFDSEEERKIHEEMLSKPYDPNNFGLNQLILRHSEVKK